MVGHLEGGCLCGAVRYSVAPGLRFNSYACHCKDCQTRSGSAFGIQLGVMVADLVVTGTVIKGRHVQPSGAVAGIFACADCLTKVYTTNDRRPGFANIRAGTLDDSERLVPGFHLWTASKQPWVTIPQDVPALAGSPGSLEEWRALLSPRAVET